MPSSWGNPQTWWINFGHGTVHGNRSLLSHLDGRSHIRQSRTCSKLFFKISLGHLKAGNRTGHLLSLEPLRFVLSPVRHSAQIATVILPALDRLPAQATCRRGAIHGDPRIQTVQCWGQWGIWIIVNVINATRQKYFFRKSSPMVNLWFGLSVWKEPGWKRSSIWGTL